jgi:ParB family chromosome partitioning protein
MKNQVLIESVRLDNIWPNPFQTRQTVDPDYVRELAADILANELQQFPAGRPVDENGNPVTFYKSGCDIQLVFGHNRLQAFYQLQADHPEYAEMPVQIVFYDDEKMAITAWSENEKRKQLNPVERAAAVQHFMEAFKWTHAQVAEKIQLDRSTVTNLLRLLKLPENLLIALADGVVTQRQATALLPFYELTAD